VYLPLIGETVLSRHRSGLDDYAVPQDDSCRLNDIMTYLSCIQLVT
jgi:hypothetical protein